MENNDLVLGIDTSNYTTSAALTDRRGHIIEQIQRPLRVKQGERGLRQSHALFQHVEQLPEVLAALLSPQTRTEIRAVAVSDRPRPVPGSYMPVFNAGLRFGSVAADCLGVPLFRFSHQEGHLAAASWGTSLAGADHLLCWHLSGGTCELLLVENGNISIAGGTKDISFGQLIDRVGVSMGLDFPCGRAMDEAALRQTAPEGEAAEAITQKQNPLKPVPADGLFFNISGIETQAQRFLSQSGSQTALPGFLFSRMAECLLAVSGKACRTFGIKQVLFTGGVSSSSFLRLFFEQKAAQQGFEAVFGERSLSADNAVGISLLGGRKLWH